MHTKPLKTRILQNRTIYLMLLPGILFLVLFAIYPIVWILRTMFYHYTSFGDFTFTGLENFATLFRDELFWNALKNTLVYAFFKLIITIPFSFVLAYFVNMKLHGRMIYRTIYFMPTIISVSIMSTVFYLIFNPYNGSANQILKALGLVKEPVNWFSTTFAMVTVLIIAVWGALGNYMTYFLSGLSTIPTDIYESAELDGATGWKRLWHITIPMMAPITQTVIMLALIQAFKDYENIMVLTSGGPNNSTNLMVYQLYQDAFVNFRIGSASAQGIILFVLIFLISQLQTKLTERLVTYQ